MKRLLLLAVLMVYGLSINAQTDVTSTYVDNPNFEARFAGWHNNGFYYVTNSSFDEKDGNVYMERWVTAGGSVNDVEIYQELTGLPAGTYTLVAGCQNVQQSGSVSLCTGATLYANDYTAEVNESKEYQLKFNVIQGKVKIGFKTESSKGNWSSIDNVRLLQEDADVAGLHTELQMLIEDAETAIGEGEATTELSEAIATAKALVASDGVENIGEVAKSLAVATLSYRLDNASGYTPVVTGDPFIAAGATIMLGRMTYTSRAAILEKGFCWSTTNKEPTVLDDRSTDYFDYNGNLFRMEHLQPGTIYYVRPYVMTKKYQVAYGDVVKIATTPAGQVSYTYDNGGDTEENCRIVSGAEEIKWLYNNLSCVNLGLSIHYGADTPTADCSYGGWMRVGPNSAYQQTGTMLHETNHGVGVGTSNPWWSSNYRENGDNGRWLGPRATKMIQFLNNDAGAYMTGDNTHMWPITTISGGKNFGMNGSWEDVYNPEDPLLYYGNVLITHAMHQDGLISSSSVGFATPCYTFVQDDDTKYYMKSADDNGGNETSFLTVDENDSPVLKKASAETAKADDNYAWTVLFKPKTGYYTFKNVGSGKMISYQNGAFTTAQRKTGTSAENVQLLPARSDYQKGDLKTTAYWFTIQKEALKATGATSIEAAGFDAANTAVAQQWLILTEDQIMTLNNYCTARSLSELDNIIYKVRASMSTPYTSRVGGMTTDEASKPILDLLATVEAEKSGYTVDQIEDAKTLIRQSFVDFLGLITPSSLDQPMDITWLIVNPDFDSGNADGWSPKPTNVSYGCAEFYETTFEFTQTIGPELPAGTYGVSVQGYQRPGGYNEVYADWTAGINGVKAVLLAKAGSNTETTTLQNICEGASDKRKTGNCVKVGNQYIPDSMQAADSYFKDGLYWNSVFISLTETSSMKIGLRSRKSDTQWWTIWDNFGLKYFGDYTTEEAATGLNDINVDDNADENAVYNINGMRLDDVQQKGVYIVNPYCAVS